MILSPTDIQNKRDAAILKPYTEQINTILMHMYDGSHPFTIHVKSRSEFSIYVKDELSIIPGTSDADKNGIIWALTRQLEQNGWNIHYVSIVEGHIKISPLS